MVDNVNTQTEKALKPIQLYDASGPQPLADERNNQFLQELFDKRAIDPIANSAYDVKSVVQSDTDWLDAEGMYANNLSSLDNNNIDNNDTIIKKQIYDDIIKISPRLTEENKAVYMASPWNTSDGVETLLHEFRHKAFDENPLLNEAIKKNQERIVLEYGDKSLAGEYNEILTRFMDIKYHDSESAKEYLRTFYNINFIDDNQDFQQSIYKDIEQLEDILRLQQEEKQ